MLVKMVVAAQGYDGPDLYFCKVQCSQEQYDNGYHYECAEEYAEKHGYSAPMVAFDENDPPKAMFSLFNWESATTYTIE